MPQYSALRYLPELKGIALGRKLLGSSGYRLYSEYLQRPKPAFCRAPQKVCIGVYSKNRQKVGYGSLGQALGFRITAVSCGGFV